jgi:hypothetical protein
MGCETNLSAAAKTRMSKLDAKTALLEADRNTIALKLGQYQDRLKENNFDGSKLENISLTAMIQKLRGSKPELVSRQAELIALWLKYRQAQKDMAEADELAAKLEGERSRLVKEPPEEVWSEQDGEPLALEKRVALAQIRMKELERAVSAGREVSVCLDSAEEDLLRVEELGEASGGMLSSAVIFEYVHASRAQASLAQRLMYAFRYELAGESWCATEPLAGFADCFLDRLIKDFLLRGQVGDPLASVRDAQNSLELITTQLNAMMEAQRETLYMLRIELAEQRA